MGKKRGKEVCAVDSMDWLVLKTLYEQQNITKASELLFVSQPALSYRIQQIEKEFNVSILARSKKGIRFTSQGEYLYKYAMEMLKHMEFVKANLLSMNQEVSGVLKIGATRSLIKNFLPNHLVKFTKIYPDVEFRIISGHSKELAEAVRNREIQVGFIRDGVQWDGEKQIVLSEKINIVSNRKVEYEELADLNRILYISESSLSRTTDRWWKSRYNKAPNIIMTVDSLEAARAMVRHGIGYAILPDSNKADADGLYRLPLMTEDETPIVRESWLIYQSESLAISTVRMFIEQIQSELA